MNYSSIKRHCPMPRFATQKLGDYLLSHPLNLVTESNLLKYLLSRLPMLGHIARGLLQLSKFVITAITSRGFRSQALIVLFPSGDCKFV